MIKQIPTHRSFKDMVEDNSKKLASIIKEDSDILQKTRSMSKGFVFETFLIHIAKKNGLRGKHFSSKLVLENLES